MPRVTSLRSHTSSALGTAPVKESELPLVGISNTFVERFPSDAAEIPPTPSHFATRTGWYVLGTLSLVLVLLACFIRLPATVTAKVTLTTGQGPVAVNAQATGRLAKLLVGDGSEVKTGAVVAYLDGPADFDRMLKLEAWFEEFKTAFLHRRAAERLPDFGGLGPAEASFVRLKAALADLDEVRIGVKGLAGEQLLSRSTERQMGVKQILADHRRLAAKALDSARAALESRRPLFEQGLVLRRDIEVLEREVVDAQLRLKQLEASVVESEIAADSLKQRQLEFQRDMRERESLARRALADAIVSLQTQISAWRAAHVIVSPAAGTARFFRLHTEQDSVRAGDTLMTVEPNGRGIEAAALVSAVGFGKVSVGQTVVIELDDYPVREYGPIIGAVSRFSRIAENDTYRVSIVLPDGAVTTYGKTLRFAQNMPGRARFKVRPDTVRERIVNLLRATWMDT